MRPTTPIPDGCSMTFLACHVSYAGSQQNSIQRVKSENKKFSIFSGGKENSCSKKYSLKGHKEKMAMRNSCKASDLLSVCSEFSSVIAVNPKPDHIKKESITLGPIITPNPKASYIDRQITEADSRRFSHSITGRQPIEITNNSKNENPFINVTNADEITLNQLSGSQKRCKERETVGSNYMTAATMRRVHTEENRVEGKEDVGMFTERGNRVFNQVYRSQLINGNGNGVSAYRLPPSLNSAGFTNNSATIIQRNSQANNPSSIPQRSPALKKSTYLQGKASIISNIEQRASSKMVTVIPNPQQLKLSPLSFQTFDPPLNHLRKISSPRFPKKCNTLYDLNCKNVDSSGGEHTSSNHVSILASQDSINGSSPGSNGDEFAKVIKLMTLKSMPLSQGLWASYTKKQLQ